MDGYVIGKQESDGIKFLTGYNDWGLFNTANIYYELISLEKAYRIRNDDKEVRMYRIELEPVSIVDIEDKISEVGQVIASLTQTQKLIAKNLLNDEISYKLFNNKPKSSDKYHLGLDESD